ncbi:MAG: acetate/propionate family kinase [Pseudomonadota bacterium]
MSIILTLNAGSSSTKFSAFSLNGDLALQAHGKVADIGNDPQISIHWSTGLESRPAKASDYGEALTSILDALAPVLHGRAVIGVGHRIVHGGDAFSKPAILTDTVLAQLAGLESLAPLHQPQNLRGVEAARRLFPNALQVGCFDTAFHRGHAWVNDTFALPRRLYEDGVKRYGFHGLSYQYIADKLRQEEPALAAGRVVVAHLGNGSSLCAMRDGVSVASTMGFSALDGLPMGTRCGQLDPGVILYLLQKGMTHESLTRLLYEESGLKGLSGISHDMRTLLSSDAAEASQAVDYFTFCVRREIGSMVAILGGLDALVFCGGIGESAPDVRLRALDGLAYLGLSVSEPANDQNAPVISDGAVPVLVVPTNEERVIADATSTLISEDRGRASSPIELSVPAVATEVRT